MSSRFRHLIYVWPFCYHPRSVYAVPLIPVRGFLFFLVHPELWGNFFSVMAPQLGLTCILFVLLYFLLFTIQILWGLGIMCVGPLAPVILFLNFLHQVDSLAQRLGLVFFYQLPLDSVFDYVYSFNAPDREDSIMRAKVSRAPKYNLVQTITITFLELPRVLITWPSDNLVMIITIWMMTIPGIGPIVTVLVEAPLKGRMLHQRYYELKGLDDRKIAVYQEDLWWSYYILGMITGIVELVPFISTLLVFTNRTGAAMWATDLENYYIEMHAGENEEAT